MLSGIVISPGYATNWGKFTIKRGRFSNNPVQILSNNESRNIGTNRHEI